VNLTSPGLNTAHYLDQLFILDNLMARANMPPQGKHLPGSTMIKCNWDYSLYHEIYFTIPPAFELQMVNICDTVETISIHLQRKP
jgi:hypothetical protein